MFPCTHLLILSIFSQLSSGSSGNLRDLESKLSVKTGTTPIQTSKQSNRRLSNGQSIEKLTSISPPSIQPTVTTIDSELVARSLPVPPPRKVPI